MLQASPSRKQRSVFPYTRLHRKIKYSDASKERFPTLRLCPRNRTINSLALLVTQSFLYFVLKFLNISIFVLIFEDEYFVSTLCLSPQILKIIQKNSKCGSGFSNNEKEAKSSSDSSERYLYTRCIELY